MTDTDPRYRTAKQCEMTTEPEDPWAFFSKPPPPLTPQEEAARRTARRWRWLKRRRADWRYYYPNDSWTGARIGHFRRLFCVLFHGEHHYDSYGYRRCERCHGG
jgi:hypothetical protein